MILVSNVRIGPLLDYLDGLTGQADQEELGKVLQDLNLRVVDLEDFVHFDEQRYVRTLLEANEHAHALLLCWRSGQRSPIHNHPGTVGGVRVLRGIATETLFDFGPCGLVKATGSRDLKAGGVITFRGPHVHQMSNLQKPGEDLITLHVYSPPLVRMDTFSLTERAVGEFRPGVFEHAFGSGI